MCIVFLFTFLKSPGQITSMLTQITKDMHIWAITMHAVYLILILVGIIFKKIRNIVFPILMLILSASATVISIMYMIIPNVIIFATFFILTLIAFVRKELDFDFVSLKPINKVIGSIALVFAFYYLHWVENPLFLKAIFYSPLGIVNCPTMLAFCGFLCFLKQPGSKYIEFFVASITLYFGFLGIMRLGAYIDIILIITALFILIRKSSFLDSKIYYS
jgi:hypothetical protein